MTETGRIPWIVRIPTPIGLIGLIVAALLADLLMEAPAIVQHRPLGLALLAAGLALSAWGRLTFGTERAEIFPWSESHAALVTGGPFRFTRNPMYLGLVVIGFGTALVAGTWLMWLVPALVFVLDHFVIIPFEERSMERTFGEAYRDYMARVRRWI